MKRIYALMVALIAALLCNATWGQQTDKDDGRTPPIAVSGGAEISEIHIERRKASYASKDADLTYMQIKLWLPGNWQELSQNYLVKIVDLNPIEDETGNVLTTKKRLEYLRYLNGEVAENNMMSFMGKAGPQIGFTLEAPARQASKIKSIKGKAEVSRVKVVTLRFNDVTAMCGETLKHPKLKDYPVRPTVEIKDGQTNITLGMRDHQMARIHHWYLEQDGKALSCCSEGATLIENKFVNGKSFQGDSIKKYTLVISLAEPIETKVFDFDFQNVELP